MCGIAGIWTTSPSVKERIDACVAEMRDAIPHRGPDDAGSWSDPDAGVAVGQRRLSILDLSPEGHQPMLSPSGRWVVVYNGEIYNYEALRGDLDSRSAVPSWRGHSDTEVLCAMLDEYGVRRTVEKLNGMFAFAAWDQEANELYLVRDRVGIKPLYLASLPHGLAFGSELRAVERAPGFHSRVDRGSLSELLAYGCIPAPNTIYEKVRKLEPGTILRFVAPQADGETSRYWDAADRHATLRGTFSGDAGEAVDAVEDTIRASVRRRMISDVPLGAFLSGGVDSSTVVAIMQELSDRPVRTFTIGFEESSYDEAQDARAVAESLGTDHQEMRVRPTDVRDVIPRLHELYDEPFADSSQLPTFLVSELARRHVTVALSGDGGDELFAGYNRHVWAPRVWRAVRRAPSLLRKPVAALLREIPPSVTDRVFNGLGDLPGVPTVRLPGDKLHKIGRILDATSQEMLYERLRRQWLKPEHAVRGEHGWLRDTRASGWSFEEWMMLTDFREYLPDDILTKVDRASMAVSLEARVPLLDHELVELAWSLPLDVKQRGGVSKWVLREVLYRRVDRRLIERPKMGFGIPVGAWLRGPLREWSEDLLSERSLSAEGFFNAKSIRKVWRSHLDGDRNAEHELWPVLMFQQWNRSRGGAW